MLWGWRRRRSLTVNPMNDAQKRSSFSARSSAAAPEEEEVVSAIEAGNTAVALAWCTRVGQQAATMTLTSGNTLLHLASEAGDLELVKFLLLKGASPAVQNADGQNSLHLACQGGHLGVLQALVSTPQGSSPAAINQRDHYQCMPLHLAIENGSAQTVGFLLSLQAQDRRTRRNSAKVLAERHGQKAILRLLKDKSLPAGAPKHEHHAVSSTDEDAAVVPFDEE